MRFAVTRGERGLSALSRRLFKGPGATLSRNLAREASQALVRANPILADLRKVPAGTVIVVPDVPGVTHTDETSTVLSTATSLLSQGLERLAEFREVLDARQDSVLKEAQATLTLLRSSKFRAIARKNRVVKERVPTIKAAAAARLKRAESFKRVGQEGLTQLETDLADFLKGLG